MLADHHALPGRALPGEVTRWDVNSYAWSTLTPVRCRGPLVAGGGGTNVAADRPCSVMRWFGNRRERTRLRGRKGGLVTRSRTLVSESDHCATVGLPPRVSSPYISRRTSCDSSTLSAKTRPSATSTM